MSNESVVKSLKFACIYVDQLDACKSFYETYLGFQKTADFGPDEIFGTLGEVDLWMGAGYQRLDGGAKSARATVMFGVTSVGDLFNALKSGQVQIVQDEPVEMQEGVYWLQFVDPAGNVIEVLGGE
ncbi:MAG TPA: VOC family protein [Anaerolineales bacterium]|nr:VOC family protein [Anaerolineales bacterium]